MSALDLADIKDILRADIDGFVYEVPKESLGVPWTEERVRSVLAERLASLVEPYWAEVHRTDKADPAEADNFQAAVVAEFGDSHFMIFDPTRSEFALAWDSGDNLNTIGVAGDAVGCMCSL